MKKYTNEILITGLLIILLVISSWFAHFFYQLKKGVNEQEIIPASEDAVTMISEMDENGNMVIRAERTENGETKTITIDPNTGTVHEKVITTKTTTTTIPADTAKQ